MDIVKNEIRTRDNIIAQQGKALAQANAEIAKLKRQLDLNKQSKK